MLSNCEVCSCGKLLSTQSLFFLMSAIYMPGFVLKNCIRHHDKMFRHVSLHNRIFSVLLRRQKMDHVKVTWLPLKLSIDAIMTFIWNTFFTNQKQYQYILILWYYFACKMVKHWQFTPCMAITYVSPVSIKYFLIKITISGTRENGTLCFKTTPLLPWWYSKNKIKHATYTHIYWSLQKAKKHLKVKQSKNAVGYEVWDSYLAISVDLPHTSLVAFKWYLWIVKW